MTIRRFLPFALLVIGAIGVLFAMYLLVRDAGGIGTGQPQARSFTVTDVAAQPADGLPVFDAAQGDTVTLVMASGQAGFLHIHSVYNVELELEAGVEKSLTFDAAHAGRYLIEAHYADGSYAELAALEVQPR